MGRGFVGITDVLLHIYTLRVACGRRCGLDYPSSVYLAHVGFASLVPPELYSPGAGIPRCTADLTLHSRLFQLRDFG